MNTFHVNASFVLQNFFPTFLNLPSDNSLDLKYYNDKLGEPTKHWCLIAEIVEVVPHFRPMLKLKDKAGRVFLVTCYFDYEQGMPHEWTKHARKGNSLSIMYAEKHVSMDGQQGIRLEDVERVKV